MRGFRKHQLAVPSAGAILALPLAATVCALTLGVAAARAEDPPAPRPGAEAAGPAAEAARVDELFAELAEPGREDWERVEGEIVRLWSKSGSPAMDLLLRRGNEALEAEDLPTALEHFGALTDHAPEFAEGWNGRATTFYLMGEYSLAIADVERVLALEPRHFGAWAGLAFMLEAMDEPELALRALQEAQKLNPNRPNINQAVSRLERLHGQAEL